jgi:histidinol-phosphate/aromatic aminotransferase/cobyric acid decarboxylase-like protein/choline kinase
MKAIILAAGYGNRMRPLTDHTHKTLLRVNGKTIIEGIVDGLLENGVNDLWIVTGYLADELQAYLQGRYPALAFHFIHNPRFYETNNIYSLSLALNAIPLDDDILLIESDLVCQPEVFARIMRSPYPNVALVDRFQSGMDGTVVTVADGLVTSVIPPYQQSSNFDFSDKYKTLNIYKFSRAFCQATFKKLLDYYAKVIDDNCYYEVVLGILIYLQHEKIHALILEGEEWAEVDDPNDLRVAEFTFNKAGRLELLQDAWGGYWNHRVLDFAFIRNMYFPDASMISQIKNNLAPLIENYGSKQEHLNRKMAYYLQVDEKRLHWLNGASQIFPLLRERYAGLPCLLPGPTFGEYPRIFPNAAAYADRPGFDTDEIAKKAAAAELIVFVNPNNPTGSVISTEWVYRFAADHPQKHVLVDESFIEFSGQPSVTTLLEKAPLPNLVVLKSLSKSLGVPGLRIGYAYSCDDAFNAWLTENLPIWNINSLAEFFMEIILKHRRSLENALAQTIRDRQDFAGLLSTLDFIEHVYPSGANFILAAFRGERQQLAALPRRLLSRHAIYIKDVSSKFDDGRFYVRFAVRLPAENRHLIHCLNEM